MSCARCEASTDLSPESCPMKATYFIALTSGIMGENSGEYPILSRISFIDSEASKPNTLKEPEVGEIRPNNIRIRVVFPAPLGPRRPTDLRGASASTLSSAVVSPYNFVRLVVEKAISANTFPKYGAHYQSL
ncbi:MAG: hypothetical protein BAJATHORv1_40069 [Candidatus Thorarchaeota archaeon]|nr:MAG: hypothetical protein BAJATHORv1_40069 [Candidatus Thorarchaeota archaeon]